VTDRLGDLEESLDEAAFLGPERRDAVVEVDDARCRDSGVYATPSCLPRLASAVS
jgi:hypothetical protein